MLYIDLIFHRNNEIHRRNWLEYSKLGKTLIRKRCLRFKLQDARISYKSFKIKFNKIISFRIISQCKPQKNGLAITKPRYSCFPCKFLRFWFVFLNAGFQSYLNMHNHFQSWHKVLHRCFPLSFLKYFANFFK